MTEDLTPYVHREKNVSKWELVRPIFHEFFQFWPDHEDLIWAKSVWPILEDAGLFADVNDEAEAWTRRHILALAILYAESARCFGTPDFQWFDQVERGWLLVSFGSQTNLDGALEVVGRAVCFDFPRNKTFEGDPDFFLPLIRSLVTGSGFYIEGPALEYYLQSVEERNFDMHEFREDCLREMWIGGHFSSGRMSCLS
ncbi:hypothetical protein [Thalassovita sp.]|uniref:hypothetical protein n=1 Tax=Thalassovita sp. TaxID=1979401 RepID=UPI0029DE732E|nr:hypothetical protein [Thalassovita sp.]